MSRSLSIDTVTAISATEVSPIFLFEAEFASGMLRCWSGFGNLSWNSFTWEGAGTLMSISNISETSDVAAKGVTIVLNGLPSSMVYDVMMDMKQNAGGKVYIGFLDADMALIDDPVLLFEGRLDVPTLSEGADTSTVTITYESRLIDLQRTRESRYTNEDQQRAYPGDKAFEFVPNLQEIQINWGRNDSSGVSKPTA